MQPTRAQVVPCGGSSISAARFPRRSSALRAEPRAAGADHRDLDLQRLHGSRPRLTRERGDRARASTRASGARASIGGAEVDRDTVATPQMLDDLARRSLAPGSNSTAPHCAISQPKGREASKHGNVLLQLRRPWRDGTTRLPARV
jgi:hypothetical protein